MRRRALVLAGGAVAAAVAVVAAATLPAATAHAQPSPLPKSVGVYVLLGDSVRVVARQVQEVNFKDVGMDDIAGAAAQAALLARDPQVQVLQRRAPEQVSVDAQRAIGTAADLGTVPDWLLQDARSAALSQVLLITSNVGAMEFKTALGQVVGNGRVAGVGFYVSADGRTRDTRTGHVASGYLAPFAVLRMVLVDVATRSVVHSVSLSEGYIVGPPEAESPDPWRFLTRDEKAQALRALLGRVVTRGMGTLLKTP